MGKAKLTPFISDEAVAVAGSGLSAPKQLGLVRSVRRHTGEEERLGNVPPASDFRYKSPAAIPSSLLLLLLPLSLSLGTETFGKWRCGPSSVTSLTLCPQEIEEK